MAYTAEIFTSSIVAVGDFNPAIFSPDWMEVNGLIGKDDADSVREGRIAKSLITSHQVATFETKWFALQVLENQFSLTSKDALSSAIKDLAVSIFQLVPHTPVTAVGLNFIGHFRLATEAEYHRVGDVLAPKEIWNALYPNDSAGLADLTIRIQSTPRGQIATTNDEKRIAVQPSAIIRFGAFMSYNDHHDLRSINATDLKPGERTAALIDSEWEPAWRDAVRAFDGVLTRALGK